MNGLLIEKIKQSGYTDKHLAKQIGVSQTFFSQAKHGHKNLSEKKEGILKELLKGVLLKDVA